MTTFSLVSFSWIFFRAGSLSDAFVLIGKLFTSYQGSFASLVTSGLSIVPFLTIILSIILLIMLDEMLKYEDCEDGSHALVEHGAFVYWVWVILIAWGLLLSRGQSSTFIYFQF